MKTPYFIIGYTALKYLSKREKEFFAKSVEPKIGSILKCSFVELDHSGIYIGNNKIIDLHNDRNRFLGSVGSNSVVQETDPKGFLTKTAFKIYVACDLNGNVLANEEIAKRAKEMLNQKIVYNLALRNCHKFSCDCITNHVKSHKVYSFKALEKTISKELNNNNPIVWRVWDFKKELF